MNRKYKKLINEYNEIIKNSTDEKEINNYKSLIKRAENSINENIEFEDFINKL